MFRFQLPMEDLERAGALSLGPRTYIEFATLSKSEERLLPQFWAYGPERDMLLDRLETAPEVTAVSQETVCDDRIRYTVRWDVAPTSTLAQFSQLIQGHDATFLFGRADQTFFRCLLQFPSNTTLLDCYADCECAPLEVEDHSPRDAHAFVTGVERHLSASDR